MNKKQILIIVAVLIVICLCGLAFYFLNNNYEKTNTLVSSDNKFSIDIPNSIHYQINSIDNNEFVIDLFSKSDEMFMYASTINKLHDLDLNEVTQNDKASYLNGKENVRDDSGIIESSVSNNKAFEYSFVYYDSEYGKDFYSNVIWIETSDNVYVLTFEVVNDNSNRFKKIFTDVKNSFKEL